ncbi:MAG: ribosome biogenesis GTPase Der [Bryobacterales bacterium]|nr:ribosome biogenesis GTPase Der [Bryobacterales bacterium]
MAANPESLPLVVIVGRPNVGKSTLFNAITGTRRAIVGDEPGITRDRIHGIATHLRRRFRLTDTGGIVVGDRDFIPSQIYRQARLALEEAVAIIYVIDGRTEITAADRDLLALLRAEGKRVTLAVNKIDAPSRESLVAGFYELGIDHVFAISAEHRLGIRDLLDHITRDFPEYADGETPEGEIPAPDGEAAASVTRKPSGPIRVAIIGRPNVGKSTLLNALTGEERAIVSPIAGTTRDAVDELVSWKGEEFLFIDTAGIRRKGKTRLMAEKLSVVMARKHMDLADVVLLVVDAEEGIVGSDATIAGYAHEEGRAVIIIVNKWDLLPAGGKRQFERDLRAQLKFLEYAPVIIISALEGEGVHRIFPAIQRVYAAATKRIGTGELNRFASFLSIREASKIYYMTQVAIRPPTFVLFVDRTAELHFSSERYVINQLREAFGFEGTPIRVKLRSKKRKNAK